MVTETKRTSYLGRIGNSIKGVLFGLILVCASSYFLFTNEGSVDLSEFAVDAMELFGIEELETLDGEFIALTGEVVTDETLEDEYARLDDSLYLKRDVETYAWVEKKDSETTTNTGGSSTTKTTYTYSKKWVSKVPATADFKDPAGHENVYNEYDNGFERAQKIQVAGLEVDTFGLRMPPASTDVTTQVELLTDDFIESGEYLFNGVGTLTDPQIGDARVKYYSVNELDTGTLFGKWNLERNLVDPYYDDEVKIHGLYVGNKDMALETMHSEYLTRLWMVRMFALIFMFAGFSAIFAPFHTVLSVIPAIGNLGKGAASALSFVLTVLLGGLIIILGKVWYSWILFVILGLIVFGFGYKYYKKSKA
jgi:hypothetical protein